MGVGIPFLLPPGREPERDDPDVPIVPYLRERRPMTLAEIGSAEFVGQPRVGLGGRLAEAAETVGQMGVFDPRSPNFLESALGTAFGTYAGVRGGRRARAQEEEDLAAAIVQEATEARAAERQTRMAELLDRARLGQIQAGTALTKARTRGELEPEEPELTYEQELGLRALEPTPEGGVRRLPTAARPEVPEAAEPPITLERALARTQDLYPRWWDKEAGEYRSAISPEERYQLALAMVRGEETLPTFPIRRDEPPSGAEVPPAGPPAPAGGAERVRDVLRGRGPQREDQRTVQQQAADRWEELVDQGVSPEEATRRVREEFNLPEQGG
jgi:hypothetical protein